MAAKGGRGCGEPTEAPLDKKAEEERWRAMRWCSYASEALSPSAVEASGLPKLDCDGGKDRYCCNPAVAMLVARSLPRQG